MTHFISPTPRQIRTARAFLDWSVHELGKKVGVAGTTISSIERKKISGSEQTLQNIALVLQAAGMEFLPDEGVRPRQNYIRVLRGTEGLRAFYEEVYQAALEGAPRTYAITRRMGKFRELVDDYVISHRERMEALHLDRIGQKGKYIYPDTHLDNIPVNYEEARYIPASSFPDVSIHIHGNMIATLEFFENDIEIVISKNPVMADSFRKIFELIWARATTTPQG